MAEYTERSCVRAREGFFFSKLTPGLFIPKSSLWWSLDNRLSGSFCMQMFEDYSVYVNN